MTNIQQPGDRRSAQLNLSVCFACITQVSMLDYLEKAYADFGRFTLISIVKILLLDVGGQLRMIIKLVKISR